MFWEKKRILTWFIFCLKLEALKIDELWCPIDGRWFCIKVKVVLLLFIRFKIKSLLCPIARVLPNLVSNNLICLVCFWNQYINGRTDDIIDIADFSAMEGWFLPIAKSQLKFKFRFYLPEDFKVYSLFSKLQKKACFI